MAQDDAKQFDPFATGELYERHRRRWRLETDVSEMTLDVLAAGTYLPPFSAREHADDYAYRRRMSVPLDMCRDAVRIRIDNLYRTPPKRSILDASPFADVLRRLVHDADGDGTPLDAFLRRALWNHYVTGVDVVTQVTRPLAAAGGAEPVVRTRADELRYGIRPYFLQFTPLQRPDWAANGSGNFLWARYDLGHRPPADETADDEQVGEFLTLTADEWRRHVATRDADGESVTVRTLRGRHGLGRPPIAKLYFAESAKGGQGGVPLSLLTRPAVVAMVAMNLKSQADADLLAAVTRWFATGIGPSDEIGDSYGPGMLIRFANPDSKVLVAQGDVAHVAEKRKWLLLYIAEMLRLLKFRGGMAEIASSSGSGLRLAIERTDLDNELRATAAQMEALELEMMRQAVCLLTGEAIAPADAAEVLGYSVSYNRDFVLEPVGQMLENLRTWVSGCGWLAGDLTEITREMSRQLVNMLAREGTPASRAAMEQIDAAALRPQAAAAPAPAPGRRRSPARPARRRS